MLRRCFGDSYRGWERQGKTHAQAWQNLARVEAAMQGRLLSEDQLPPAPPQAPVPSWLRRVSRAPTAPPAPCTAPATSPSTGMLPLHWPRCACFVPEAHIVSHWA